MTNREIGEQREFEALFANPKSARAQWQQEVAKRYAKPAMKPIVLIDKDGNETSQSIIERAVWNHIMEEHKVAGINRLPSEGEMMEACQQYYARHNASSYVARRDSMGAKPIDESKQNLHFDNQLESLSDEELTVVQEALTNYYENKTKEIENYGNAESNTNV